MNIYKLSLNDTTAPRNRSIFEYTMMTGIIVIASEMRVARRIANSAAQAEGEIWEDEDKVSCLMIGSPAPEFASESIVLICSHSLPEY